MKFDTVKEQAGKVDYILFRAKGTTLAKTGFILIETYGRKKAWHRFHTLKAASQWLEQIRSA